MNLLAISGRHADASAALSVDGRLIAAASEEAFVRVPRVGYAGTRGFPAQSVAACLRRAGLEPQAIDRVEVVNDGWSQRDNHNGPGSVWPGAFNGRVKNQAVDAVLADAWQTAITARADVVLVCGTDPPGMAAFSVNGRELVPRPCERENGVRLRAAARLVAGRMGLASTDPLGAVDRASVGGEPVFVEELSGALAWRDPSALLVDLDRLASWIDAAAGEHAGQLTEAESLNIRIQQTRRDIAASFVCRLAEVLGSATERVAALTGASKVGIGGAVFANARLNTELRQRLGDDIALSLVPEPPGRVLGAVLSASGHASDGMPNLGVGPSFTEADIKAALDNCRLDYIFEPDWPRLLKRVSRLLSQGKVVAWFHGAMGFGPRAAGTRSILCDPSGRYARQNMNDYLRRVPLDEPLPVVFAPSRAAECLVRPVSPLWSAIDAAVRPECRPQLAGALDWRGCVRVHGTNGDQAPALRDLLELHAADAGVPALIETNLCAPGEPTACTPRDAIRTVYSSAIDVLVMDRFVLMKDHWLLRADAE